MEALAQNGQSAIDTNKRLADKIRMLQAELDQLKRERDQAVEELHRNTDAVPVVRCKDCVFAEERYGHLSCMNGISYRNSWNEPDAFCSYGERKESNE